MCRGVGCVEGGVCGGVGCVEGRGVWEGDVIVVHNHILVTWYEVGWLDTKGSGREGNEGEGRGG